MKKKSIPIVMKACFSEGKLMIQFGPTPPHPTPNFKNKEPIDRILLSLLVLNAIFGMYIMFLAFKSLL